MSTGIDSKNEFRKGKVYIQNRFAGIIEETDEGYRFSYDEKYLKSDDCLPVCINMPCESIEYNSPILFPFFDGLIPEGWLLNVSAKNWKLDRSDRFGLLLVCCEDCIGDVSIRGYNN